MRATYIPADPSDLSKGISVFNEARRGSTEGPRVGVSPSGSLSSQLVAFPDDVALATNATNPATAASKLRVGLRAFAFLFAIPKVSNNGTFQPFDPSNIPLNLLALIPPELLDLFFALPPAVVAALTAALPLIPGLLDIVQALFAGNVDISQLLGELGELVDFDALASLVFGLIPPELVLLFKAILFGPYWVVHISEDYEWAIISGGPPETPSGGLCTTGSFGTNSAGFWLFNRDPQPPEGTVQIMRDKAEQLGFDVSVLVPVKHTGCEYSDTPL